MCRTLTSILGTTAAKTGFVDAVRPVLRQRSFRRIPRDEAYEAYLALLCLTAAWLGLSILDVEMFSVFGSRQLCREAMGKL
jgi:hypothetical protein